MGLVLLFAWLRGAVLRKFGLLAGNRWGAFGVLVTVAGVVELGVVNGQVAFLLALDFWRFLLGLFWTRVFPDPDEDVPFLRLFRLASVGVSLGLGGENL